MTSNMIDAENPLHILSKPTNKSLFCSKWECCLQQDYWYMGILHQFECKCVLSSAFTIQMEH